MAALGRRTCNFGRQRTWSGITSFLVLLLAIPGGAVVVDRIAISAGNKVITDSAISLRLRLSAFENGDKPDQGLAARKRAADLLIDQRIVEREMDVGHYPRTGEEGRASLLENYAKTVYRGDKRLLDRALAAYGLSESDLKEDLARQEDLLTFLNVRFRPAVQVSDSDINAFFEKTIKPLEPQASLNELRTQIEQRLAGERANSEMETWLKEQRKSTRIDYLEKDLAP